MDVEEKVRREIINVSASNEKVFFDILFFSISILSSFSQYKFNS